MKKIKIKYLYVLVFTFSIHLVFGQLFVNRGKYHNQFFVGAGYHDSFESINYGFNHSRYFKKLKREITGILDFSSPLSNRFYTRFIFRKGFQFDCYKKNDFRLPLSIITSSVKKSFHLFSSHDIITDITVLPGIYKPKFTLAAEVSLKVLLHHKRKTDPVYYEQANVSPTGRLHHLNLSTGIVLAYNIDHFSFVLRAGFQQISDGENKKLPAYAFGYLIYNLNFKKNKVRETPVKK